MMNATGKTRKELIKELEALRRKMDETGALSGKQTTERNHALIALEESEEKYRALFDNMAEGFAYHQIVLDENGKPVDYIFLILNEAFEKLTGLSKKETIGKKATEVLPGIDLDDFKWIDVYGKVALTQEPVAFERYFEPLLRWYSVTAYSPKVGYFATVFEDVTDRKKTEEIFRESEERYRVVVESTDDLVTIVDSEGRFTYVNYAAEKILGVKPDRCAGLKASDFIHPDDMDKTAKWFESCVKNRIVSSTADNRQVNRLTGETRYLHWTSNFHYDEEGNVKNVTGIARDFTKWKRSEELLKASEQRFRAIVTNAQAIIFIIDMDGTFLLSEGKALSLLGLKPGQVVGQSVYDLYADYPSIIQAVKETLKGEMISDIIDLDGIFFDIFYSPYTDPDGNIIGTIGMAIDITERKRSEVALVKSEQMAAVGEIASGIAHELNNPLATILGCTESLLQRFEQYDLLPESDREFVRDYLLMILTEVRHSANIIHDLLDFSRIRPLTLAPLQISDLILSTVNLMDIQSRYGNYIFTVKLNENLPDIVGDRNRLRQVFIILLTNAAESMKNGGEIRITAGHDAVGKKIFIKFQDEGVGIDEKDKEKIFEPYYTTKITRRGTGLGLPIARNIIEKHNGTIEVSSTLNRGSTVTVKLPV